MASRRTPLFDWHVANGGRMVEFAGYELPVQYRAGVLKEHVHTRTHVGLFDVSHMGVARLVPLDGRFETAAAAFETLVPADVLGLKPGQQRYSQLMNDDGGLRDDLMVWRPRDGENGAVGMVVNAACKEADYAHMQASLPATVRLERRDDVGLFALQGPEAESVLASPALAALSFMQTASTRLHGFDVHVSRSGYTGEDGFEIAVAAADAVALWEKLAADARVLPIGLGARDSLRLEAGYCLYGHDIDMTTSPVEADLVWSMGKRRREQGGFPGAARVQRELAQGTVRRRVGIKPVGRAPVRDGAPLFDTEAAATPVGLVTSGGFGPSVAAPVAMGYVPPSLAAPGTRLYAEVRGQRLPVDVNALPFSPHRYKR
ncbi:glycine cleavage system aminomethyltransferase GcvT [Xanthobacteraceae bacterium Astr-EGSB]|uniref:glycine cleavage system aminomethyltransferase GcvT n=1 Tax=Astrobacterium formosum TaxID=3069710 RepID=UPI0027AF9AB2|nr:glycine cleavage system aminomethyltransferase GcvT [Xanthobacteraceae bacterium Astr-EGSB]